MDRHDAQPVIQILAQRAAAHRFVGIAVGGGDEARVDHRVRRFTADPAHDPILDDAQQLGLNRCRHLDQLVEEQRAAMRRFEQSGFVADRAGERPLHVPEHLGLEQRLGERRTVHGNQGTGVPVTVGVNELRDQLFAGSALAGDEHRCVGRRHFPRLIDRGAERRRVAEQQHAVAIGAGAS